jgi:7-cyano-7-deazaguanine synthase in queuosine biosynthesis
MTRDEAAAAVEQHGSRRKAAAALHCSRHTIDAALAGESKPAAPAGPRPKVPVRSMSEFRQTYDLETIVPQRVNAALKELAGGWLYVVEFAKLAGVTTTQLSAFRDRYAKHIVAVKDSRRVWVVRPALAEEMRRMI